MAPAIISPPMAARPKKRKSLANESFRKWLNFLLFAGDEPENTQLMAGYLIQHAGLHVGNFHKFTLFLKEELMNPKNQNREKLAFKYLAVVSPVCEYFSFYKEKDILDDICFRIVYPLEYLKLEKSLKAYKKRSEKIINNIILILGRMLKRNFDIRIKGRYKNIYSIYRKMKKKGRNIYQLHDIFAFRIIVNNNSIDQCYEILNLLHDKFVPDTGLFKDYISIPKINGYQSIHTGLNNVLFGVNMPIEVQIRTKAMDDFAQNGLAAHWLYSTDKKSKLITEKERTLVNFLSRSSFVPEEEKKVYFLSYKGDIFRLEKGATALDFAYLIHTDVGNRAQKCVINGKPEELTYKIKDGDVVRIITGHRKQVLLSWLSFVNTRHAYQKIKEGIKS